MTSLGTPIQGVTLYSFTRAFHGRRVRPRGPDPQGGRRRLRPGPRDHRLLQLPRLPGPDRRHLRRAGSATSSPRSDLVPTSLAVNVDIGIRRDRLMNAGRAGRVHAPADRGGRQARLPDRPGADLAHARLDGGAAARRREVRRHPRPRGPRRPARRRTSASWPCATATRSSDSPLLGFTADWGATVTGFAPSLLEAYRRRGASEELLRQVVDLWNELLRRRAAEHPDRPTVSASAPSSASPPATAGPTSASTSPSTAPGSFGPAPWTPGSRSCRGSATCTASSSASTRTAKSPRCRCATSSGCSSRTATPARSPASTRAGTGTTGRTRSTSSAASRPSSAPPPPTPVRA